MTAAQIQNLRRIVNISLICLLLGAVLNLLGGFFDAAAGIAAALATAVITAFCYYKANQLVQGNAAYQIWRHVPTVLFVLVPIIASLLSSRSDGGWSLGEWITGVEILCSYLIPIAGLFWVDRKLKQSLTKAQSPLASEPAQ